MIEDNKFISMAQSQKFLLPGGVITNDEELRQRQKQLLQQQYNNREQPTPLSDPFKSPSITNNNRPHLQQLSSQRNLHRNVPTSVVGIAEHNEKQLQIRQMLARELKSQMQEKQDKKRDMIARKYEDETRVNQKNREIMGREIEGTRKIKEKIQLELAKDYEQRIRKREQQSKQQQTQKQAIKARLKQIQQNGIKRPHKPQQPNNPQKQIISSLASSTKSPQYYEDIAGFQQKNYQNYEKAIKTPQQTHDSAINSIIDNRIFESQMKSQQYELMLREEKIRKREQLASILEQQIKESEKRKLQQKVNAKQRFYQPTPANFVHSLVNQPVETAQKYDTIRNPVDSKFSRDNKYVLRQLVYGGGSQKSRELEDHNSMNLNGNIDGQQKLSRQSGAESGLARRGSLSLL